MPLVHAIRLLALDDQQRFGVSIRNEPIEYFSDPKLINEQCKGGKLVILLTTSISEQILETLQNHSSIQAIFILAVKPVETTPTKVIGVYPQLEPLLLALHNVYDQLELRLNLNSFLSHQRSDGTDNLNFYFYSIWRLLTKDRQTSKQNLIDHCRTTYPIIRSHIDDYEKNYKTSDILQWLDRSRHPFPYHLLLSDALRNQDEPILTLARPFLQDLSKQMKPSTGGSSSNQVYLGTQLPSDLISRFEQYQINDAIAFQCFLPLTRSRADALLDATRLCRRADMANVLFKIELNATPCATQGEKLWIDISTPFNISCVTRSSGAKESNQLLTVIKLIAVDKTTREQMFDSFLERQKALGRTIEDIFKRLCSKISDDEALADDLIDQEKFAEAVHVLERIPEPPVRVLNKIGCIYREHLYNFDKALENHQRALNQVMSPHERAETFLYLGFVYDNLKDFNEAFRYHSEALKIFEHEKKRDLSGIARAIVGMSNAKWALNQLDEALAYAERALAMREFEIQPRNDLDIAGCLGNIGNIYYRKNDPERSLSFMKRATDLYMISAPNTPRLAAALNNLAGIYRSLGESDKARQCYQQALDALKDPDHPFRKTTLKNLSDFEKTEKEKSQK